MKPRIITVEGNIGAGKSTLVENMRKRYADRPDVLFLQEPVDIWTSTTQNGKSILELFYENQEKYSFAFQVLAYTSRMQLIEKAVETKKYSVIVMERSLEADRYIFAKMLYDEGLIEEIMYKVYLKMSDYGMNKFTADGILWVHTPPDTCFSRISERGRKGEDSIPLDYLNKCDVYHKEWLWMNVESGFVSLVHDEPDWTKIDRFLFDL